jgi:hypothetical protein
MYGGLWTPGLSYVAQGINLVTAAVAWYPDTFSVSSSLLAFDCLYVFVILLSMYRQVSASRFTVTLFAHNFKHAPIALPSRRERLWK